MKQTLEVVLSFMCVHFDSIVLFYSFLNKKLAFFRTSEPRFRTLKNQQFKETFVDQSSSSSQLNFGDIDVLS